MKIKVPHIEYREVEIITINQLHNKRLIWAVNRILKYNRKNLSIWGFNLFRENNLIYIYGWADEDYGGSLIIIEV